MKLFRWKRGGGCTNACICMAYMSSWRSSKEGELPLCILEKREILRETIPRHFFHPSTFKFRLKFWNWWDIPSFEWLKTLYTLLYDAKHCILYLVDTLLTNQCISLENSIQFLLLKEKIIVRWRGPKEGDFLF